MMTATMRTTMPIPRVAQGRAGHQRLELCECDDRAGEGNGADRDPEAHLYEAAGVDRADLADAELVRRIEGRCGHRDRRQADQRVKGRDQLRQRGHLDALGDQCANHTAGDDAGDDVPVILHDRQRNRGDDRDQHADDAIEQAAARSLGRGQPAQGHDEADRREQIEEGGQGLVHVAVPPIRLSGPSS